jgi:DMSO/TMAO reductase YedYZ molybdopterin-dependent catalytic subunit
LNTRFSAFCAVFALNASLVFAQIAPATPVLLEVSGQVNTPLRMTKDQLNALKRVDFTESRTVEQAGKSVVLSVRYQGVLLKRLLDQAGLKPDRLAIRKAVVLLTAQDGYQTSFSWGELFNSQLGDSVVVVLRHDATVLLETEGFTSLRSLQDTRPGPRHVRWLTKIEVVLPVEK